jgi:hypothetical protein
MKYIAKSDGFIGGVRIRKGKAFDYEGKPGKWMEPAKDAVKEVEPEQVKPKRKAKEAEPTTFSEMAHRDGADQTTPDQPGD